VRYGAGPLALDASFRENYHSIIRNSPRRFQTYSAMDPSYPLPLYLSIDRPEWIASLIATAVNSGPASTLGAPFAYQAAGVARPIRALAKDAPKDEAEALAQQEKQLVTAIQAEARKRAPQFATLLLDGASSAGLLGVGGANPTALTL